MAKSHGNEGLNDREYRRRREALRTLRLPCWICKRPIDYELRWPDPMSFSADHYIPRSLGGALLGELRPAHLGCNSRRKNNVRYRCTVKPPKTTHRW